MGLFKTIKENLKRKRDSRFQFKTSKRNIRLMKKESGNGFFDKLGSGLRGGIMSKMSGGYFGTEDANYLGGSQISDNNKTNIGGSDPSNSSGFALSDIPFIPIALVLGLIWIAKKVFSRRKSGIKKV